MKNLMHITVSVAILIILTGCQPESYTYRYQAGSQYEYEQLMKTWIPNSGTPPPLPPQTVSSQSEWVKVSSSGRVIDPKPVYVPNPDFYFSASYGHYGPYTRGYYRPYHYRRHHSGFSLGMHYGSRRYWPRTYFWDDPWYDHWPHYGCWP